MRTVITGGAGFVGSHLCERFLAEGHEVICVDNLITGSLANIEPLRANGRFTFLRHDISQPLEIDGPVDNMLHFASPASPVDYLRHPIQTLKVGSLGTHNTLGLAKLQEARVSAGQHQRSLRRPGEHPQREDYWGNVNPIGIRGCYDEAKRFAEAMTMAYHRYHGVNTPHRPHLQHLRSQRMRLDDGRVVPNLMGQALRGEPMTVYGDGSQTRSFCYVSDLVEGIYRLLHAEFPRTGQSRQSQRGEHPRFRQGDPEAGGAGLRDRVQAVAAGRSQSPPARHHTSAGAAGVGAEGRSR